MSSRIVAFLVKPMSWDAMSRACRARVKACLVKPMSCHVKPLLWHALCPCFGMSSRIVACLVKPMSWDALSSPCRGMSRTCRGMPCQAHVLERHCSQIYHHKSCQAPIGWFLHRWHVKPMSWHACLVKPISWHACLVQPQLFSFINFQKSQLLPIASQVLPSAQVPKAQEP